MAVCKSIGIRSRREVETVSFRPSVSIRHSRLVNVSPPLDNKMNYTKKEWDIASELLHSRQSEHERKDERNMKQLTKGKFFLRSPRCTFQFPLFVWKNIFFQFCVIDAVYTTTVYYFTLNADESCEFLTKNKKEKRSGLRITYLSENRGIKVT